MPPRYPVGTSAPSCAGMLPHLSQALAIAHCASKRGGKARHIPHGKNETSLCVAYEIKAGAHPVAHDHRAKAQHGFVHHNAERLVFGRQHEDVRSRVCLRQSGLIHESEEANLVSDSQRTCLGFESGPQRPLSCKHQERIRDRPLARMHEEDPGVVSRAATSHKKG